MSRLPRPVRRRSGDNGGMSRAVPRAVSRFAFVVVLVTVVLLAPSCAPDQPAVPRGVAVDASTPADFEFTIPAGSSRAGSSTPVLPSPLVLRVGQVIRIVNLDDIGYDLGTFYVGPRETITQRAAKVGSYTSACSLHPSGTITLTIVA